MKTMTANLTIHRLLDEAFDGVPSTPATLDLKEELRANLVARVEELELAGVPAPEAARRAFAEIGDVPAFLDEAVEDLAGVESPMDEWTRHRVRYRAGFVVRAAVLPIVATAGLVLAFLAGAGVLPGGALAAGGFMLVFAILLGVVCGDSLQQETASNYPMPTRRAVGYGTGLAVLLAGVGGLALCWIGPLPLWAWLVGGGILTVAGIGILAGLGATQTNRQKPWAREQEQAWAKALASKDGAVMGPTGAPRAGTRFERDPNAAARFGIYTMIIWVLGTVAAVIVGFNVGWVWSALPWVAAFVTMMLLLTRMLFLPGRDERH
jgi:hypothetical protein